MEPSENLRSSWIQTCSTTRSFNSTRRPGRKLPRLKARWPRKRGGLYLLSDWRIIVVSLREVLRESQEEMTRSPATMIRHPEGMACHHRKKHDRAKKIVLVIRLISSSSQTTRKKATTPAANRSTMWAQCASNEQHTGWSRWHMRIQTSRTLTPTPM